MKIIHVQNVVGTDDCVFVANRALHRASRRALGTKNLFSGNRFLIVSNSISIPNLPMRKIISPPAFEQI